MSILSQAVISSISQRLGVILVEEQIEMISTRFDNALLVSAYAGCAKTSTLVAYAMAHPELKITYLAYNKAIKEEAQSKFPSNVKCITTHGVAYRDFGVLYTGKDTDGTPKLSNLKAYHLMSLGLPSLNDAGKVLNTINRFIISDDKEILREHAAPDADNDLQIKNILSFANKAWDIMKNPSDYTIPMTHDGYLKLYQLSGNSLRCDVLLIDEAQDINEVTLAIIMASRAKKIFVGDHNQSIYRFRGATNAMKTIKADKKLTLSGSFRFGEGVASLATIIMNEYGGNNKPVRGLGKHQTTFKVNEDQPHTVICRTNSLVFAEAVRCLNMRRTFGFVGGVNSYRFDIILDTYYLMCSRHQEIKDPMIKAFKNLAEMEAYGSAVDDKEIKFLVKIANEYNSLIPSYVDRIKSNAIENIAMCHVILSTGHKSKGLEFDSVILADDFTDMLEKSNEGGDVKSPEVDEVNLLYVALTRAKRNIQVHPSLTRWLEMKGFFINEDGTYVFNGLTSKSASQSDKNTADDMDVSAEDKNAPKVDSASSLASLEVILPVSKLKDRLTAEAGLESDSAKRDELYQMAASLTFLAQFYMDSVNEGRLS